MGRFVFRLPDIGEGIAEAEIVAWHVKVGDMVKEDGRLADLMTDKATVEMESPAAGKVLEVAGEVGDVIAIGSPLVVLETKGEVDELPAAAPAPTAPAVNERIEVETPDASDVEEAAAAVEEVAPSLPTSPPPRPTPSPLKPAPAPRKSHAKVLASPAVRARAKELGI